MVDEKDLAKRLKKLRRDFHTYPESGWTEYRTSNKIAEQLEKIGFNVFIGKDVCAAASRMGVPTEEILAQHEERALADGVDINRMEQMRGGQTGVIGVLKASKPGPVIALRFDIDALNIAESVEETHLPEADGFRSVYDGVMHACGHDGHAAIGLGVATLLAENGLERGEVRLIFQPAEEGCRGAKSIVANGWLDGVDYFYSGHIGFQSFHVGEIVAGVGRFLATTKLDVTYRGKAAHAGNEPEAGRNALLAAAAASLHLHSISRHSEGKTRINVGTLRAGTGRNIIPDRAMMEIETRGETDELNDYMTEQAIQVIESVASLYGVDVEWEIVGQAGEENSDAVLRKRIARRLWAMDDVTSVVEYKDFNASEDIVDMLKHVHSQGGAGSYLLFGAPIAAGHHADDFNFDEDVLVLAARVLYKLICES